MSTTSHPPKSAQPPTVHDAAARRLLIRASAGTGKTYRLTRHYLDLLHAGIPPETILATTFTRKAAGEILSRIVETLAHRANGNEVQGVAFSPSEAATHLAHLLRHLHRLQIGTLDSYFAQLAGSHAFELGLPPGWTIGEELDDAALRREAIAGLLTEGGVEQTLELMHLLTKGESKRGVSDLIGDTVNSLYELFQDTEPKAWSSLEPKGRLKDHELAAALEDLREASVPTGKRWNDAHAGDYAAALVGDWDNFIGKGLSGKLAQGETTYYSKDIPADLAAAYDPLIKHAKGLQLARIAAQNEGSRQLLEQFHERYQRLKQERALLRFEDITRRLANLADSSQAESAERRAFRMDGHVQHLLLDEFQDTSAPQWRAVRPLAELPEGSFFCVGDTKQAIFGWRGGVAEIFDTVAKHVPGITEESISKSFRSSQPVIDTVNRVFSKLQSFPNPGRAESTLNKWQQEFPPHETALTELPGYVRLECAPTPGQAAEGTGEESSEEGESRGRPTLVRAADLAAEIAAKAPQATIGILPRKNAAVAELTYLLRKRGLEVSGEGGNPLTDTLGVRLLLSLLRLAEHPADTAARFHLASSPLAEPCGLNVNLLDKRLAAADPAALALSRVVRGQLLREGYGKTLAHWAEQLLPSLDTRERQRMQQFLALAHSYDDRATLRIDDFLRYAESTKVADPNAARLRVMNIHQAKGLEFDCVILPELEGGLVGQNDEFVVERPDPAEKVTRVCHYVGDKMRHLLPDRYVKMHDEATRRSAAENMCVLYVALTRAARAMYLIIPPAKDNEKKLHSTTASLLRHALAEDASKEAAAPGAVLYQAGNAEWHQPLQGEPAQPAAAEKSWQIALAPSPAQPQRGLPRTAPSHLEGDQQVDLAKMLTSKTQQNLRRGEVLHAFFSQIQWLEDPLPSEESLLAAVPAELASPTQLAGWLQEFHRLLKKPTLRDALTRESFAQRLPAGASLDLSVHNERTLWVELEGGLLTGSIDRLVLARHAGQVVAAAIIDFKTDGISPGDEAALAIKDANYAPQIRAYRRAVESIYRLPPERISAWLLYTQADRLREIGAG